MGERVADYDGDGNASSTIEAWQAVLEKISNMLGIGKSSNVVIINNFMRFSHLEKDYNSLCQQLLKFVFERLSWSRFSLCSSGPAILKNSSRKTGIVFDITEGGFIYCLPVGNGRSLDSSFRLLFVNSKNIKPPFLSEVSSN